LTIIVLLGVLFQKNYSSFPYYLGRGTSIDSFWSMNAELLTITVDNNARHSPLIRLTNMINIHLYVKNVDKCALKNKLLHNQQHLTDNRLHFQNTVFSFPNQVRQCRKTYVLFSVS